MAGKVKCLNCGRIEKGINSAKNDGWLVEEDGSLFCCVVCKAEYRNKQKNTKKVSKNKKGDKK